MNIPDEASEGGPSETTAPVFSSRISLKAFSRVEMLIVERINN
jgi:hypothetical protein